MFWIYDKKEKTRHGNICCNGVLFFIALPICYFAEKAGNPVLCDMLDLSQVMGNMEGKEVRFGIANLHYLQQ